MNRVLKQSLSLFSVGVLLVGSAACLENTSWADKLNFYDGKTETAHITEISGDIVRYRKGLLHEFSTTRLRLTDRQDTITVWGDKKFTGEIHYIDSAKLELLTDSGTRVFWKAMVKDIQLGSPKMAPVRFTPASSSMPSTSSLPSPDMSNSYENSNSSWTPEPQPSANFSEPSTGNPAFKTEPGSSFMDSKPRIVFPEN